MLAYTESIYDIALRRELKYDKVLRLKLFPGQKGIITHIIKNMDRISLKASERTILGKKVKTLRKQGLVPAHVFGKGLQSEHVSVDAKIFLQVAREAGETGVIDLKIAEDKVRPVMIRGMQRHAVTDEVLNVDFYQVNLKQKVTVPVPLVLIGEEPEKVKLGEAIVLQTLNDVEVEALPADLVDKIEVNIEGLKEVEDVLTVGQLSYNHETLKVLAEPETIVVKLAPAVTEEMQALLEEQAAEQAEAAAEETGEEGEKTEGAEGEETPEGEEGAEAPVEGEDKAKEETTEEKPAE